MHIEFHFETKSGAMVKGVSLELLAMLQRVMRKAEKPLEKRMKSYCPKGVRPSDLGLEVTFVRDREIQKINKELRGKDRPTDVVSMSYIEDRAYMPAVKGEVYPAGEIFLSVDTIARQAKEQGLLYEQEMAYMLVHGLLHVLAYDHETDREEREMEKMSFTVLGKLYPRREEFGF